MPASDDFHPTVAVCADLDEMTARAHELIVQIVSAAPTERKVSFALSGGSTPRKLYESLHECDLKLLRDEKRVLFFMGDDRLYPLSNEQSNYHMANAALLHDLPGECILPVDVSAAVDTSEDPREGEAGARVVAKSYEDVLLNHLDTAVVNGVKVPVADIVLLGFGSDGHTASVFPDSIAASESAAAVSVSFPSPTMHPKVWRVTMTPLAICSARHVIVLAAGKDKQWVVDGITSKDAPPADQCPVARFLRACKGQVHFIVDHSCAGKANL